MIGLTGMDCAYSRRMKSMTGYGRGDCSQDGFKITVELSSVNRKQTEISVNLPREMELLEAQIRDVINRHVARGRLTVRVSLHAGAGKASARMHLNVPLAKAYARELSRLSKQLNLPGPVTLDQLARAPGVFQTDEELAVEEDFWPAVEKALKQALVADGEDARAGRGAPGAGPGGAGGDRCGKAAAQIQKHAPTVAERYRQQLIERIKSAGLEAPGGRGRAAAEGSGVFRRPLGHFGGADAAAKPFPAVRGLARKSKEPVGRMLDFLAQEMNREINTIGSKANDSLISREVVTLKAELEKFREQAQNVE